MESTNKKLMEHANRNALKYLIMMSRDTHRLILACIVKYVSDYNGWICYIRLT